MFNARRKAAIEVLTGDFAGSCAGFLIARSGNLTAGQVLVSNSKELPEGWWLLHYLHQCRDNLMEEWFRTADDIPNQDGNHLICRHCGFIGLRIEDV